MRLDKFTTKFQQALADAQSLAIGHDNQMIDPTHLLLALLQQDDGSTSAAGRAFTPSGIAMNGIRASGATKHAYGLPCAAAWIISGA